MLRRHYGIRARVVSFPCQRIFETQPLEYKRQVLRCCSRAPRVVVEGYAINGWERYADAGYSMGSFRKSLPENDVYKHFGFYEEAIAARVKDIVEDISREGVECLRGEFRDPNSARHEYGRGIPSIYTHVLLYHPVARFIGMEARLPGTRIIYL